MENGANQTNKRRFQLENEYVEYNATLCIGRELVIHQKDHRNNIFSHFHTVHGRHTSASEMKSANRRPRHAVNIVSIFNGKIARVHCVRCTFQLCAVVVRTILLFFHLSFCICGCAAPSLPTSFVHCFLYFISDIFPIRDVLVFVVVALRAIYLFHCGNSRRP